jgi:hypothetical protein
VPGATLCVQITPSFLFQAFLHLHEQLRTRADLTTGMTRKQMDKLGDGSNPPYYTITTSEEVRTYAAARPWKTPSHVRSPSPPLFFFSRTFAVSPAFSPSRPRCTESASRPTGHRVGSPNRPRLAAARATDRGLVGWVGLVPTYRYID